VNVAAGVILTSAAICAVFAFFAALLSRAPGFRALRGFATIAGSAACFNLADVWMVLGGSEPFLRTMGSLALAFGGAHGVGWIVFTAGMERRPLSRLDRFLCALCVLAGVAALVPGLTLSPTLQAHEVPWLDVTWVDTPPTAFGLVVYLFFIVGLFGHGLRLAARWRRGVFGAGTFTLGFAVMLLVTVNDALVSMGVWRGPYLLDLGFLVLVASAWRVLFLRFVDSAAQLKTLSQELEQKVAERTQELARAEEALLETDRLAALGTLSAGVAHAINNPSEVVLANIEHLDALVKRSGASVDDVLPVLDDAQRAAARIARIVRQLLDAGRVASGRHGLAKRFTLFSSAGRAIQHLSPELLESASFAVDVAPALTAWGNEGLFEEALANVVRNAAQAVERKGGRGRITITGAKRGDRVEVSVTDDGPGLSEPVRHHLFEPFSTARDGRGEGLGLAVSLGLLRAQGGALELAQTEPGKTEFRLSLPANEPKEAPAEAAALAPG